MPPLLVTCCRSLVALAKPSPAELSRGSSPPDTTAPAHPPTPESTATYCFPSGPLYVTGWPMIPEPVLNFQSSCPETASTALNQPSMLPKKTTLPAVTTAPLQMGNLSFSTHT